ncbi:protein of unknown function [Pseudomonas sp. JV551A1]|nr:protein of unknown function [Pseudomonas sp. JV551A1]
MKQGYLPPFIAEQQRGDDLSAFQVEPAQIRQSLNAHFAQQLAAVLRVVEGGYCRQQDALA